MKAKLTYKLPKEEKEHLRAVKSLDLSLALWQIEQYLRDIEKNDKEYHIVNIRETFYDILGKYDINLDNLIE